MSICGRCGDEQQTPKSGLVRYDHPTGWAVLFTMGKPHRSLVLCTLCLDDFSTFMAARTQAGQHG